MKSIIQLVTLVFLTLPSLAVLAGNNTDNSTTTSNVTTSSGAATSTDNSSSTSSTTHSTTTTTVNDGDANIVSAVYAKYAKDSALIGTTLTVSCSNGVVSVAGSVTAQSQADEAVIAAKAIPGVKDVRSTIQVMTHPNVKAPPKTPNY